MLLLLLIVLFVLYLNRRKTHKAGFIITDKLIWNVRVGYYLIPFTIGVLPNLLFAIFALLALVGSLLHLQILAIPFIMGLYINMFYCFPAGLLLHWLGTEVYVNVSGSMIAPVTWAGMTANMAMWIGFALIINHILGIKIRNSNACSKCGRKTSPDSLRCENCGASLITKAQKL